MGPDSEQGVILSGGSRNTPPTVPRRSGTGRHSIGASAGASGPASDGPALFPRPSSMTVLAFGIVVVPFAVILGRLVFAPHQPIYLPDDLALIDLHSRRALEWKQQLGVFDRYNWNHPGPSYFYLLSVFYRVFGSGARAMFIGATALNALAAVGCVAVVRRRTTPARALWAAVWICALASLLATESPGSITYSEGALGALVSPWNPMVVIFPLLLFVLLCAAAVDRSPLSLGAAVIVASVIVQTNISTLPLVAAVLAAAALYWAIDAVSERRRRRSRAVVGIDLTGLAESPIPFEDHPSPRWRRVTLVVVGVVVFILMWLPPVIQQLTNSPGNFGLIYLFFTEGHTTLPLAAALRSVASVYGVLPVGPSEVMSSFLGGTPNHALLAYGATAVVLAAAVAATVVGIRQHRRFAAGVGSLTLIGSVAMAVGITRVVGFVFGYLVVWAIVLPIAALIGLGMLGFPLSVRSGGRTPFTSTPPARVTLCLIAVVAAVVLTVRVVDIPPLATVSSPQVARLYHLSLPRLDHRTTVLVNDNGAGTGLNQLLATEEFIGLVNQLDQHGYQPRVNQLWKTEFGPGYLTTGADPRQVQLSTWTPSSARRPGYVGRVGDIAVMVLTGNGTPAPK
jgi:hypothetical protein